MLPDMARHVDIAMTPAETLHLPVADCYVVIDGLRATTTIATLFTRGLHTLTVVDTLDAGRAPRGDGVLLFGEQGGIKPEGFDYGNSPVEAARLELAGRSAALVTSNGTVALCAVARLGITVAGSLANLSAVASFAGVHERVVVVCAGNDGARRFSLEDFTMAAALVQRIAEPREHWAFGDGARLALEVGSPDTLVGASTHASLTRSLGFQADVEFASQSDTSAAVPLVTSFGDGWAVLENRSA